jgi:hypothetical protein
MALSTVTDAALARVRALLHGTPRVRPIVFVKWEPAGKDLRRGPNGEAIWEHIADAGWEVTVLDWDPSAWPDRIDAPVETTTIRGIEFSFVHSPGQPPIEGRVLDFAHGEFVIT